RHSSAKPNRCTSAEKLVQARYRALSGFGRPFRDAAAAPHERCVPANRPLGGSEHGRQDRPHLRDGNFAGTTVAAAEAGTERSRLVRGVVALIVPKAKSYSEEARYDEVKCRMWSITDTGMEKLRQFLERSSLEKTIDDSSSEQSRRAA